MALFLSSNIHQGDDLFSVHSRGKQCSFMTLSVILKAHDMPLTDLSKQTFDNVLVHGDNMYIKALHSGLLILDDGVEGLSIDDLPTVVDVSFCRNMSNDSSYEICRSNNDLPIMNCPLRHKIPLNCPLRHKIPLDCPLRHKIPLNCPLRHKIPLNCPLRHKIQYH